MNRRRFLAGAGIALLPTFAGCLGSSGTAIRLCYLGINSDMESESVEAEFRIREGESTIEEGVVEIEPGGFADLNDYRPTEPGQYVVEMRTADTEWEELDTSKIDSDQVAVEGRIERRRDDETPILAIFRTQNPHACE